MILVKIQDQSRSISSAIYDHIFVHHKGQEREKNSDQETREKREKEREERRKKGKESLALLEFSDFESFASFQRLSKCFSKLESLV